MNHTFWTNTVWYAALAATSAAALTVCFAKTHERRKTIVFYFAVLGFTYNIEVSLLLLFNAYTYYPMIRPDDPFFDAVLGNIFSQVSVSSSAVLICTLGLSYRWLAAFSAAYFFIDMFFVQLGIYQHYWYRSVYTLAGFFIYGLVVRYFYGRVFNGPPRWIYRLTLFLAVWSVSSNSMGTFFKLTGIRIFQSSFYNDPSKSHTAAALIYVSVMIIIMIALHSSRSAWPIKVFIFLVLLCCQWGLLKSGIILVRPGWEITVLLLDLVVLYGCTVGMDRWLCGVRSPPRP